MILLTIILRAYYRDTTDLEKRMLINEKRIEELQLKIKNYDTYIEHELRTAKLRMFFDELKKENNTQEGSECEMPCGRKKGRGGKRK